MEGTGRTCLGCQASLAPRARFCPKCGQPTGFSGPEGPGASPADWADRTVTQVPSRPFQDQVPPPAWPQDPRPYVPPPAHDYPPYGQPPGEARGFESFRPFQPGGPAGGQPPPGPPLEPFPALPRQPPRRHDRNRSGTPLALWVIVLVVLLGGGAAAAVLVMHPFSHPSRRETASGGTGPAGAASANPARSASTAPAAAPATSASPPAVTEQQAATSVATMLGQSVSDRAAINTAYNDVMSCDSAMASAPKVFDDAASSRQRLLARLAALPGRATLPPALLSDLTQAWQASVAADQAFAQWASGELQGCTPDDTGSAAYQATVTPDDDATKDKTAFVAQWNPVAARYNLTQYQQGQL